MSLHPGLPRKVQPILILLKQETVSGSGAVPYACCTMLQTDNHANTLPLTFYWLDAFPAAQPTALKH